MVTVSGDYPPGANITLKAKPNSGETFVEWWDADNKKSAATSARHSFTLGSVDVHYTARFEGGTTSALAESFRRNNHIPETAADLFRIDNYQNFGMVDIHATAPVRSVEMYDSKGRLLYTSHPDSRRVRIFRDVVRSGVYLLRVRIDYATVVRQIIR